METSRRDAMLLGMGAMITPAAATAQVPPPRAPSLRKTAFEKDSERPGMQPFENIHEGVGTIGVKMFRFGTAPSGVNFLIYDMPPGASEGTHVHRLNDESLGSFDEYYYIVSGSGVMEIDRQIVQVAQGDHIFTPLDVHHGIENTSKSDNLKVFLTYVERR